MNYTYDKKEQLAIRELLVGKTIVAVEFEKPLPGAPSWECTDMILTMSDGSIVGLDGAGYEAEAICVSTPPLAKQP